MKSLFLILLLISTQAYAAIIHDNAHLISPNDFEMMERWIDELEAKTTAQIAIVTEKSIGESSIEDYAVRTFEKLGVGQKNKDNGILLLIALQEHLLRIEVGYGLEDVVTDAISSKIINSVIVPEFKREEYSAGILKGVGEMISLIALNSNVVISTLPTATNPYKDPVVIFVVLFWIIMIVVLIFNRKFRIQGGFFWGSNSASGHNGGSFGGGGCSGGGGASGRW